MGADYDADGFAVVKHGANALIRTSGGGSNMHTIEARPYGLDISAEELEALRARVYLINEDTVLWHEVPVQTIYLIGIFGEKLAELTREMRKFYLMVNLAEAGRPSAEIINALRNIFRALPSLQLVSICTGKNFILNVAAKFVLERVGFVSYSIHQTQDEALQAIEDDRKKTAA